MRLSKTQVVTGLTAVMQADNPATSWNEPLGAKRTTLLPLAVKGYECRGLIAAINGQFTLDVANGSGTNVEAVASSKSFGVGPANYTVTAVTPGLAGDNINVTVASPEAGLTTTVVELVGVSVTITPGAKGAMQVTGAAAVNGYYSPDLSDPLNKRWTIYGTPLATLAASGNPYSYITYTGAFWVIMAINGSGVTTYLSQSMPSGSSTPEGLTYGAPNPGSGTPSVAAAVSCLNTVAQQWALNAPLVALATFEVDGSNVPIASVGETHLEEGVDAVTSTGCAGKDPEGKDLIPLAKLSGLEVYCMDGAFTITSGTSVQALPVIGAGGSFVFCSPDGITDGLLTDYLVLTALSANTRFGVVAVGMLDP